MVSDLRTLGKGGKGGNVRTGFVANREASVITGVGLLLAERGRRNHSPNPNAAPAMNKPTPASSRELRDCFGTTAFACRVASDCDDGVAAVGVAARVGASCAAETSTAIGAVVRVMYSFLSGSK